MKLFKKKKIMKQFESAKDLGEMGRVLAENDVISAPKDDHHNVFGESIDHLDEDGGKGLFVVRIIFHGKRGLDT